MIFICYNDFDLTSVSYLNQILRTKNLSTWVAYEKLLAGDDIDENFRTKIKEAECFIFCIGKNGVSEKQENNLLFAIKSEKRIIPVLLPNDETEVYHSILDKYTFIDFRKEYKDKNQISKLLKIIAGDSIEKTELVEINNKDNLKKQTSKKAVSVAIIKNSEILIVQRADSQKSGGSLWQLPGGKVDNGESIEQTAIREIKEEVGIDINVKKLNYINDFIDDWVVNINDDYIIMSLYVYFTKNIPLDLSEEFKNYKWIPLQDLFEEESIIYFGSTSKYLKNIRRYVLTHLPLNQISTFIKDNLNSPKSLPKKLNGISKESTTVIYSFLSLLGFLSDRESYLPSSTLSHQLINILSEWSLTDGAIFEAIEKDTSNKSKNNNDPVALAKFKEGLFDHHSSLLGLLSHKLPKALSYRRVADLLIFGKSNLTNEKLLLVRWDFLANKYQIPSKGLEEVETDIKDIKTAKNVLKKRFNDLLVDNFNYAFLKKFETQHIGAGSLSLLEGDGPMLRNYLISIFKLNPKPNKSNEINEIIEEINKSTIKYLQTLDNQTSIKHLTKRNLNFYTWVSVNRLLNEPKGIVGEVFQGFSEILEFVSPEELLKDTIDIEIIPQENTPITFTSNNYEFDHKNDLREKYASRKD